MIDRRAVLTASLGLALPVTSKAAETTGPSSRVIQLAKTALNAHSTRIPHRDRVAIADFSLFSARPRFHIVDVQSGAVKSFLVAHGKGSDPGHTGWLKRFSNAPGSEATSEGAYVTGDAYYGNHGLSRRLVGLDPQNSNAESRAIVIHSAWYVSTELARKGAIGRSQGCFALASDDHKTVMDLLGAGRLIMAARA